MRTLLTEKTDGIGRIVFRRPEARNAVNLAMMEELEHVLDEWERDETLRLVLFRGDRRAFVSGGDLDEFHRLDREGILPVMKRMGRILQRISEWEVITMSVVEGPAVGGGCELAASTDFCIASERALFGMIQVKLGITSGWGGGSRLMKKIGISPALELLLTGERISAGRAWELGLVDRILPEDSFEEKLNVFIRRFADAPVEVVRAYKQLARQVRDGVPASRLTEIEAENCAAGWNSDRHRQAVESFLRKTRKS
ncbi:enoyl-CoA hydratase/isomerase family protein [Staphylospora marina]|uniref:enoyl-CoA hydratase/isomerase family protein n=1 Tax=Staphylospora marina TaxID=2490858 RepID=UPI0013DDB451|nr:enoyl-CoA hydratase/isomerase family protein [Staphylospora marina]